MCIYIGMYMYCIVLCCVVLCCVVLYSMYVCVCIYIYTHVHVYSLYSNHLKFLLPIINCTCPRQLHFFDF